MRRGTSVSDVQISVRHCSDVIIVNTHSRNAESPKREPAKLLTAIAVVEDCEFPLAAW